MKNIGNNYPHKFNILDEMGQFLKRYKLPKSTQETNWIGLQLLNKLNQQWPSQMEGTKTREFHQIFHKIMNATNI